MPRYGRRKARSITPAIGTVFKFIDNRLHGGSFRVTGYLCEMPKPSGNWIDDLLYDTQQKINGKKLMFCRREDAEFVSGAGVCGCVAAIDKIEVIGRVSWSSEEIKESEDMALRMVGRPAG